ncbi:MAG: hypothetical protein JSV41_09595 [Gemmatimonadota bacterium]|nr:MAG: hypothetical protein JSV41_09595 [Gemmatimonadota bacterium]
MTSRVFALALALAVAGPTASLLAQQPEGVSERQGPDTLFTPPPLTPGGAFLRSLVVPGWAQAELGFETRGAFYFLAEGFSLFMVARSQIRLSHAERTVADPETSGLVSARRQQREDWIALAVFWAFFSAADGWVSVHLFGFEERTGLRPEDVAFRVGWKIPFGP